MSTASRLNKKARAFLSLSLPGGFVYDRVEKEATSLAYVREANECRQEMHVSFSKLTGHFRLEPFAWLCYPSINEVLEKMQGEYCPYIGLRRGVTFSQSFEAFVPYSELEWTVDSDAELESILARFLDIYQTLELPFLDRCQSITGLIELYCEHDRRLWFDRQMTVIAAAGCVVLRDYSCARRLLDEVFARPGAKLKIASVYSYLDNLQ